MISENSNGEVYDTQSEIYADEEHLSPLHSNARGGSTGKAVPLSEFTMELEEPIEHSDSKLFKRVEFEGHVVVLENRDITKSHKLKFQMLGAMLCLLFIGLCDQVIGSLIEYVLAEYQIDRVKISYLFMAQFCGYIPSSIFNNYLMGKYGLYKLYASSCIIGIFASIIYLLKLPYIFLPFSSVLFGWVNGTYDCCMNYFVGTLDYSNQLLGIMHSMYGVGCLITPVLSIYLVKHGMLWNHYYFFLIGTAFLNLLVAFFFFQNETSYKYRYVASNGIDTDVESVELEATSTANTNSFVEEKGEPTMFETLTNKYIMVFSFLLFLYVGSELSVGIWLNNYLFRIKQVTEEKASYITSTFWFFMTLGRIFMGFYTGKYFEDTEIRACVVYSSMVSLSCVLFWFLQFSITLQVISICIAAWFLGPLFGTTIIIAIKTLPKRYSLNGISLIAGFGGTGAAIIPAVMGYISENVGSNLDGDENDGAGLVYFPQVISIAFTFSALCWLFLYLYYKRVFDQKLRLT